MFKNGWVGQGRWYGSIAQLFWLQIRKNKKNLLTKKILSQYALGACVNLPGQIFLEKIDETNIYCNALDTKVFLNIMTNICCKHKQHKNRNDYYEPSLFQCDKVWVRRENKKKLSSLYHGPYTVLHASEHIMLIQKNDGVAKVSIGNLKAYFPRDTTDKLGNIEVDRKRYNLRKRETVVNYKVSSNESE